MIRDKLAKTYFNHIFPKKNGAQTIQMSKRSGQWTLSRTVKPEYLKGKVVGGECKVKCSNRRRKGWGTERGVGLKKERLWMVEGFKGKRQKNGAPGLCRERVYKEEYPSSSLLRWRR